jgi:serine protease Do
MRRLVPTLCLPLVMAILAATPGEGAAPPPAQPAPPPMPKNLADLHALEAKIQKTLQKILPATVGVGNGGSGVVVSKDGLIVSVAHVTQKAGREIIITFPDGKRAKAKTLGNFKSADASLLKMVDKGPWPFVNLGKSTEVKPGHWALAVGYPVSFGRGQKPPVRIGRVLRQSATAVTTDCPIMGGDSGGPLFDLEGRVIGVNSRVNGSMLGNVHVAIDVYHNNWKRLYAGEDWGDQRGARGTQEETAVPMPDAPGALLAQKQPGQRTSQYERNNEAIRSAFREAVEPVARSTVRVLIDGKPAMLGTIVAADGLIVTKATALTGKITCKLPGGKEVEAKKLGEDKECDLALLEVPAKGLTPVTWGKSLPVQGSLVAAAGEDGKAVAIGMVTSEPRQFRLASRPAGGDQKRGYVGISTVDAEKQRGARIEAVRRNTPAEKSGLKVGDVITKLGTETIKSSEDLTKALRKYLPDVKVDAIVERGDKKETISITLAKPPADPNGNREPYDRWGGGPFSDKRFGYPKVLPHDTVLEPRHCGGPLVDTHGRVVGLNVSRSLRISTYALLPADVDRVVAKLSEAARADRTKKQDKEKKPDKEKQEKEKQGKEKK